MMTDQIADMLTRIRNGYKARLKDVVMPGSRIKEEIARILKREKFIKHFEIRRSGNKTFLRIFLDYGPDKEPAITGIERKSKPGRRMYVSKEKLPKVAGGLGIAIISTSKGILTDEEARAAGVGGEVICQVW